MRDVRSRAWVDRRIALCGDAAAGVLPTAGVGASNAMRAAACLADELARANGAAIPQALALYEKRCRRDHRAEPGRVAGLARVMLLRNGALWRARDLLARRYPAERALSGIIASTRMPF
jgi:2-polyprenyl-6-methoxyphenol hydroxylase-like FAD-dependent oxidoreductase